MNRIRTGTFRDDINGPMQVVSGPIGRQRVHFEAPPATRLDAEMTRFIDWVNADTPDHPVLKAGIGHLWFVTLHPFDDGNYASSFIFRRQTQPAAINIGIAK